MTLSIAFVTPQETKIIENPETFEEKKVIDIKAYRARIQGYNRMRWVLILQKGMRKSEVDGLSLDELVEAHEAALLFAEEEKKALNKENNG